MFRPRYEHGVTTPPASAASAFSAVDLSNTAKAFRLGQWWRALAPSGPLTTPSEDHMSCYQNLSELQGACTLRAVLQRSSLQETFRQIGRQWCVYMSYPPTERHALPALGVGKDLLPRRSPLHAQYSPNYGLTPAFTPGSAASLL